MKRRLLRLVCRTLGHSEPVQRDYDLSAGKIVVERCGRCSAFLDSFEAPPVQYPRRRLA